MTQIQEFDEKEKTKRDFTNKLKEENLLALQRQMEDRRARMSDEDKLNMNEANLNNYIGTNIDYKHPSEVYGYGVPGLGMSHDRKQQLGYIDRNLDFTKTLSTKAQAQQPGDQPADPQRRTNPVAQSQDSFGRRNPRNDYEYIRLKNSAWGNKFDIISNKIKDFAK